jgi:hypothetical protein
MAPNPAANPIKHTPITIHLRRLMLDESFLSVMNSYSSINSTNSTQANFQNASASLAREETGAFHTLHEHLGKTVAPPLIAFDHWRETILLYPRNPPEPAGSTLGL